MTKAQSKGIGLVNARSFAIKRFGPDGWQRTLASLSLEDRDVLAGVVSVGWYPLELHARVTRAIDEVHGVGDLALAAQLGRFQADTDLTTVHRVFLKLISPNFAVEKLTELWPRYHDSGRWVVARRGDDQMLGQLHEFGGGFVDPAICRTVVGYITRCVELVGAKNVLVDHTECRAHGDGHCGYHIRWGVAAKTAPVTPASNRLEPLAESGERPVDGTPGSIGERRPSETMLSVGGLRSKE
jgi:hypothetical protein